MLLVVHLLELLVGISQRRSLWVADGEDDECWIDEDACASVQKKFSELWCTGMFLCLTMNDMTKEIVSWRWLEVIPRKLSERFVCWWWSWFSCKYQGKVD
jgi:hypothetical protein